MGRNATTFLKFATPLALLAAGLFFALSNGWAASGGGEGSIAASPGADMDMQVYGDKEKTTLLCDLGAPLRDCGDILIGEAFSLDVIATSIPAEGYTRFQTVIEYDDDLINLQQQSGFDEVVWPDEGCDLVGFGEEAKDIGRYRITCKRAGSQNSFHTGALANIQFVCKQKGTVQIDIVGGDSFADPDLASYYFRPVAVGSNYVFLKSDPADSVLIDCVNPTPTPTPTPTITPTPTASPTPIPEKAEMFIQVYGDKGKSELLCDGGDLNRFCVDYGGAFSVDVVSHVAPIDYTAFNIVLQYPSNITIQQQAGTGENRHPAGCSPGSESKLPPDGFTPGRYTLNCKTGESNYNGPLANINFQCGSGGLSQIEIIAGEGADVSYFVKPSIFGNLVFLNSQTKGSKLVADSVVVVCPLPAPGDLDQDGCTDQAELGPTPGLGGQRDYTYFWDVYDVWTHPIGDPSTWIKDKSINLPGDILGVAARFGPGPTPPPKIQAIQDALVPPTSDAGYHIAYDRGPQIGPNPWDRAGPDGVINIPDDILGVAAQFGLNCT